MDFVFGTYINDELKFANYRAVRNGVQHQHNISPIDPQPGDAVTVRLLTSGDSGVTHAALYYTTDESVPRGSRGKAENGQVIYFEKVKIEWDSPVWDYLTHWQAIIPAQAENTLVQYIISAWSEAGEEIYADWPNPLDQVQHVAMVYFENIPADSVFVPGNRSQAHVFNYHVDTIQPPQWAREAIIYHIFVDRFYPGDGRDWLQTEDIGAICGGTLWGVRDKLDYLADLGINCIWLSPIWVSPSIHGYDVSDYDRIEPRMGGEDALRAVVEGAHQRGIRVLLDMACNHISNEHPFFVDALNNEDSPYRDWFHFDLESEHGYKTFFNVATMPEVNLTNPEARHWMIESAVRWLRDFDVDGYRLDYANGPGPDFWSYFRRACKVIKPDCLLFGEIIEAPDKLRQYTGRLDGCLDFPVNDALRRTFAWQVWQEYQFKAFINSHHEYFPDNFIMPTFIDNHDMNRFSFIVQNDSEALKQAVTSQFQLPNPPVIYYGTETGVRQMLDTRKAGLHVSRVLMNWDDVNRDLLAFYKQRIENRKNAIKSD